MATETENPQSDLIPARPGEPLITEECPELAEAITDILEDVLSIEII